MVDVGEFDTSKVRYHCHFEVAKVRLVKKKLIVFSIGVTMSVEKLLIMISMANVVGEDDSESNVFSIIYMPHNMVKGPHGVSLRVNKLNLVYEFVIFETTADFFYYLT